MSATERQFVISDEELVAATPVSYAELEVPGDYEAVLVEIKDYDKTEKGGTTGWEATFRIEGLPFKVWISHSQASRWKLIQFVHSFIPGFFDTRNPDGTTRPVPVNDFVGRVVGAHVILDDTTDTPRKIIDSTFSLEEEEPSVEDVPTL